MEAILLGTGVMFKTSGILYRKLRDRLHYGFDFSNSRAIREQVKQKLYSKIVGVVTQVNKSEYNSKGEKVDGGLYVVVERRLDRPVGKYNYLVQRIFHFKTVNVKYNQEVNLDTILGEMGNTGLVSTGEHEHLEFFLCEKSRDYGWGSSDLKRYYIDPMIVIDDIHFSMGKQILANGVSEKDIKTIIKNKNVLRVTPHAVYYCEDKVYTYVHGKTIMEGKRELNRV